MTEGVANSDGIYCVSVEIISLLRLCLASKFKGEADLTGLLQHFIKHQIDTIDESLKLDDSAWGLTDVLLGVLGTEPIALATGRHAKLKDGHEVVVLGFSEKWLTRESIQKWKSPHPPLVTIDMMSKEQKVLVMSTNETRPISS